MSHAITLVIGKSIYITIVIACEIFKHGVGARKGVCDNCTVCQVFISEGNESHVVQYSTLTRALRWPKLDQIYNIYAQG